VSRPDIEIRSVDDWRAHFGNEPMPSILRAQLDANGVISIADFDGLEPFDAEDRWSPARGDAADLALDLEDTL
jgi:hypothetical protein